MIDRPTVDRIMNASNIVEVVSDFVSLRKTGTSYKGLCPFHDDRTPSFSVSPVKGVYKCFSCGAAGNAVKFIMEHEQMTYPEALKWLANKYHIEVHERELTNEEKQQENERESMFLVNEWAAKYFNDILHNDDDGMAIGMQYFRSRGFRDDIIRKFQLGFCLSSRHAFADAALKAGFQRDFLIKTGLCFERENGELIDRFNGRVMFPWVSVSGKVTAFGGRLLDSRTKGVSQKYVNSPDSVIYHKERELYGIFQAKKAIAKHDLVYMVEGYTDVVSMHQCGIENVVANSGTALSVHQIRLLRRFTPNIVLLYDGDEAGQHAALRGTDMLLAEGMNVKVLLLPDGKDPDEFARSYSAEDFRKYIEDNQTDFIVFKINVLLKGVTDPIKRSEAVGSIVQSISVIKDPILRDTYLKECSNRTNMKELTLMSQMNHNINSNREQIGEVTEVAQESLTVEDMLIQAVVKDGEKVIFRDVKDENSGQTYNLTVAQYIAYDLSSDNLGFSNELYTKILQEAVEHCDEEGFKAEEYFTQHADINIASVAVRLSVDRFQLAESLQVKETEQTLRDRVIHLVADFRLEYVSSHLKELNERLLQVKDSQEMQEIMSEIMKTQNLRNELAKKTGSNILV
ncbi:DNA primase [Prevotella melaninogenica]|uniref:DNA primase n=1 Tax=Prevotella melaninogenica TaxID=28132 RepID=UPI001BAB0B6B|nr:DNA primase [Prevotella melaninogenica]QUB55757.1 DNA primase [Prevotella melaninogenica]QUB58357.1 DNA primase [Prevotella melaninogenica]